MRPTASLFIVAFVLACSAAACASTGGASGGSADLITREQIDQLPPTNTVQEVIRRLRPRWLIARGNTSIQYGQALPQVYVDGLRMGGPEALDNLQPNDVQELRFISAADATTLYGTDHAGGIIQVTTRRR